MKTRTQPEALPAPEHRTDTARRAGLRRRPTGAPPPLPRKLGTSGRVWIGSILFLVVAASLSLTNGPFLRFTDKVDAIGLSIMEHLRTSWLTPVMRGIKVVGSGWAVIAVAWITVGALLVYRRARHLLVFLGSYFLLAQIIAGIYDAVGRPRPYGVRILSGWGGFSMPSPPIAILSVTLLGVTYTLVTPGRARSVAKWVTGSIILLVAVARTYLAVDHPSDIFVAGVLTLGVSVIAYRMFVPNEAFPVTYGKGKTAHLDVGGARGEAIRRAVHDQLGLTVLEIKPIGLEASGGSTPLRLKVAGDPDTYVFAKLYAKNHVRADRWYKIWRTIANGRLEDEAPFQTVRRFVEYEDYTLRLMNDVGIPTPAPYGIVEITPGLEYMIVMEFFEGAEELGDAAVDDHLIDEGLLLVRKLWDSGLAHRDIKPANLMCRDGHVLLIDVFFVQVRPSPWRHAVDLANMMLVLAVRTDAQRVYERALAFFSPEDVAEAFAASHGVAIPGQLRDAVKRDGRNLPEQFCRLAPPRRPIPVRRWGVRRVGLALGVVAAGVVALLAAVSLLAPVQNVPSATPPECGAGKAMILMAQAVPSATQLPCIEALPSGWSFGGADIHDGQARMWLSSDRAGARAVEVTLTAPGGCRTARAVRVPTDVPGIGRFELVESLPPHVGGYRFYTFPGGCVTYRYAFAPGVPSSLLFDIDEAMGFEPRATLVDEVMANSEEALCGVGASCRG